MSDTDTSITSKIDAIAVLLEDATGLISAQRQDVSEQARLQRIRDALDLYIDQIDAAIASAGLSELPSTVLDGAFLRYDSGLDAWVADTAALADLSDVSDTLAPVSGHFLRHDGIDWKSVALVSGDLPAIALNDLSDVVLTSAALNEVLIFDGTDWVNQELTQSVIAPFTLNSVYWVDVDTYSTVNSDLMQWNSSTAKWESKSASMCGLLTKDGLTALTGNWDAGSFEIISDEIKADNVLTIPYAAGGKTVNASGEICVDTTSKTLNFYNGAAEVVLDSEWSKSVTIETPTSDDAITIFRTNKAITITKMVAVIVAGTSAVYTVRHSTDRTAAGNEVVTSGTTCNSLTTGTVTTSFNDATVPADSFVWVDMGTITGSVTQFHLTIFYTVDA